jgi:peroxiredoxin Q/BCP
MFGVRMLKPREEVPGITLGSLEGKVNLRQASEGIAVFYFCTKDHTSGCIKEAKSFRDAWRSLKKLGVRVYKSFAEKHSLNFLLPQNLIKTPSPDSTQFRAP